MVTRTLKKSEYKDRIFMGLIILYAVYFGTLYWIFRLIQSDEVMTEIEDADIEDVFLDKITDASNTELLNISAQWAFGLLVAFVIGGIVITIVVQLISSVGFNNELNGYAVFNAYLWITIGLWLLIVGALSTGLFIFVLAVFLIVVVFGRKLMGQDRRGRKKK